MLKLQPKNNKVYKETGKYSPPKGTEQTDRTNFTQ